MFEIGDNVKILETATRQKYTQTGGLGWCKDMDKCVGKIFHVKSIYPRVIYLNNPYSWLPEDLELIREISAKHKVYRTPLDLNELSKHTTSAEFDNFCKNFNITPYNIIKNPYHPLTSEIINYAERKPYFIKFLKDQVYIKEIKQESEPFIFNLKISSEENGFLELTIK